MSGFKKSTIKTIIRNKLGKVFASVEDETLRELMKRDTLVTGGAIASMCLGEKINDYDLYFKSFETAEKVAAYYVDKFNKARTTGGVEYTPTVKTDTVRNIKGEEEQRLIIYMKSAGVAGEQQADYHYFETQPDHQTADFMESLVQAEDDLELVTQTLEQVKDVKHDYRPIFLTNNAISLTDKTQIIIRFYGTPEEIHKNFDFVHCQGVYDYQQDELLLSSETLMALMSKQLVYTGSLYPVASVIRMRKFLKRGWNISAGQIIKMLHQISLVNWEDPNCLNEQLMGVDVAYMHELIAALQNRDKGQRIDTTYLASLIDTIFDDR